MKKLKGFSLVELMISLIVISVVTAAFAPVVTKKLKMENKSLWGSSAVDYTYDESVCSKTVSNCSVCIAESCVKCDNGYYLDNNECKKCSEGAMSCINITKATKCENGYYLNGNLCSTCPEGCATCSSASSCSKCSGGYKLENSTCVTNSLTCSAGCVQCNTQNGECGACAMGYYKNGNNCSTCASNCLKCTASNNCQLCASSTYWNGSSCVACGTNCADCQTSGCKRCINNTVPSGGGCTTCAAGRYSDGVQCQLCDNEGIFTCNSPTVMTGCMSNAPYGNVYWGGYYASYMAGVCCQNLQEVKRCAASTADCQGGTCPLQCGLCAYKEHH